MSSAYIGYTPSFAVDTTNQVSDQLLAIVPDQVEYTLKFAPVSDNLILVFVNGETYVPTVDYVVENNTITFTREPFPSFGSIYIFYLGVNFFRLNTVSDNSISQEHLTSELKVFEYDVFEGDGNEDVFTLHFVPGSASSILVFINGVIQRPFVDYQVIESTLTFSDPPAENAEILCRNLGFKGSELVLEIPDLGVTSDKISSEAITNTKYAPLSITNDKIHAGELTLDKLSSALVTDIFGFEWVSTSTTLSGTKSRKLLVDTSAQSINIILPASPAIGQYIEIIDIARSFDEYPCTVIRNGLKIGGLEANYPLTLAEMQCRLIYDGNDNWGLFWLDHGRVFTSVITTQDIMCPCVNPIEHTEGATLYSDVSLDLGYWIGHQLQEELDCQIVYPFSVATNASMFYSGETLTITLTFATGTVALSGSGIKPTLELTLSDNVTTVDAILNTTTSTTSVLKFDYEIANTDISEGVTITGYDENDYTITVAGLNFDFTEPLDLDIRFSNYNYVLADLKSVIYLNAKYNGALL